MKNKFLYNLNLIWSTIKAIFIMVFKGPSECNRIYCKSPYFNLIHSFTKTDGTRVFAIKCDKCGHIHKTIND